MALNSLELIKRYLIIKSTTVLLVYNSASWQTVKFMEMNTSAKIAVSYGINPFPGREINNVILRNEYIEVTNRPLNFRSVNDDSTLTTHQITIENSELYTSSPNNFRVYFIDSKNILLKNNRMNTNVETINSTNITEEGSVIVTN